MDKCLVGLTIKEAINKMDIDTTHFIPMLRSGREIQGIYIRLADTCKITVIVEEPFVMSNEQLKDIETNGRFDSNKNWKAIHRYILDYKTSGVCWKKNTTRKEKIIGDMKYISCWDY